MRTEQISLTRAHKAAVVLAALSPETASAIIKEISDAHLKAFARAFTELKSVPGPLLHSVAQEFVLEVERLSADLLGGAPERRTMLESLAGGDRVNKVLSDLRSGGDSVWIRLAMTPPPALLDYLRSQRRPIAALIVSKLPFEQAAALFSLSDTEFANSLLLELARSKAPPAEILDHIAKAIEDEFLKSNAHVPENSGVNQIVSEIVNFLPSERREIFLSYLESEDKEAAGEVRKGILTFDCLHQRLAEAGASVLLRDIDREALVLAFRHGESNAPETVRFLLSNVSKRMAEQYQEEMRALGAVAAEDGENAQRLIMKRLRALAAAGEIKLLALAA